MPARSVFCTAASRGRADHILHEIEGARLASAVLSVLLADPSTAGMTEPPNSVPVTSKWEEAPSGVIPGLLSMVAGVGRQDIAGVGRFISAGPVAAAWNKRATGAEARGLAGGLNDFGVPQVEAGRYACAILDGAILIAVHTDNREESDRAKQIFMSADAQDVFTIVELPARRSTGVRPSTVMRTGNN